MKTNLTKNDAVAIAVIIACAAFVSFAAPALYVLLAIVAVVGVVAGFTFAAVKSLLASDCPLDNAMGVSVMMSLFSLLNSINE